MPTSRSARKQQTRLAFSPLPSSSPAAYGYHQQIRDRAATITLETSPNAAKRNKLATLPTPVASLERPVKASGQMIDGDSDDEPIPTTRWRKRGKARQQRLDFNLARNADSFDSPIRLPSSSRSRSSRNAGMFSSQGQQALIDLSSDESDGPDQISSPARKPSSSRLRVVEDDDEESDAGPVSTARRRKRAVVLEESEDEDGMPTTIGKQRRRPKRRGSSSSFIVDSPPRAVESDDDVLEIHVPSKKRRRQATESEEEKEDDDGPGPKTPNRRRSKQRRIISQQDRDDLADDMNDLGASSDFDFHPQTSQSTQKSARQAALDRLKRKRTGQLPQVAEEEAETSEKDNEGQENDDLEETQDEDEDDEDVQITSSRQMFRADDEDADFIEEAEDEGPLGIPEGMPIGLTRYASMKPKELFKYAVEWMVQKKINPAFSSTDQIYELTFKKLDDELRGLASSKFTSSAWTKKFTLAMQARPEIAYERLDRNNAEHSMRDKCDACNRSGHPATYELQFRGKPYHRQTLEDIADDDDEGENESDSDEDVSNHPDEPAHDAQGREIVAETHSFYVGKFCKSNAETAHSLHHWKHALYDWVLMFLTSRGYLNAENIVARESWNTKKRRKYANKIVDRMEKDGEVKRLWRNFKEQTDVARNSKQGRFAPDSP